MDECAAILSSFDDPQISAYCLAGLEGASRVWLGRVVRDTLEDRLAALQSREEDEVT